MCMCVDTRLRRLTGCHPPDQQHGAAMQERRSQRYGRKCAQ
jgi:hypothetical protein